jgi:hypothetical protein
MKKNIVVVLLLLVSYILCHAQNLDSIPQDLRDSILIGITKDVVLKYGPGYYRDYKKPEITRGQLSEEGDRFGNNANRPYYLITFYYDPAKERLDWDFSYKVYVWKDNWQPFKMAVGCGLGCDVSEALGKRYAHMAKKRVGMANAITDTLSIDEEIIEPFPYQAVDPKQRQIIKEYLEERKKIEKAAGLRVD